MPTSTTTAPRHRRWVDVETAADAQTHAETDLNYLDGRARPRELAPTVVVARRLVDPDASVVPTRFPSLPWASLAARRADGYDVGPDVRVRLREAVRGHASTPGQVVALRAWLSDVAIPAALARVNADAVALVRGADEGLPREDRGPRFERQTMTLPRPPLRVPTPT